MKIAGLDIGTTGCKLTVFDENGNYLDRAYSDYPVVREASGHEIHVENIMDKVYEVITAMAKKYPDIAGIGITSFGETFVMTDENGKPLHTAMLYTDPRGADECKELVDEMGGMYIASITGVKPHEMYSISKIMWIKKNRPEIYEKAKHIFLMEDYVVYHLTHVAQIDYSLASRTMAFDISSLKWCDEIFEKAQIDSSLMSKPVPTGTVAGCIIPEIAKMTGLSEDTKIISMSHDQVAASVGSGVFDSKTAVDGAGTCECMTIIYDELPALDKMYDGSFAVVPYVIPGKYVCYAFLYTGGALIQWCTDVLAKKEKELAKEQGISVNEMLEANYTEPTRLMVLPHFAGAATPYMDTESKGVIVGLTTDTSVADIYKGCMEGVVYEVVLNMEMLQPSGLNYEMIHATGGGAKSKVWMQMKADMLNTPITALKTVDAGTVGCAMMTGIAIGCFRDLEDAAAHMVEKMEVYHPNIERYQEYQKIYKQYKQLYKAVRPLEGE